MGLFPHMRSIRAWLAPLLAAALVPAVAPARPAARPTIVLVHGAFADTSSWNDVVGRLEQSGYRVLAAANPLRGLASDAANLAALLRTIEGPIVLVGHSYGGSVITMAAGGAGNVRALVYVAAFLPDRGETALGLSARFAGSTLAATLAPAVPLPDGNADLYIRQDRFRAQFAADLPVEQAAAMAVTQRPVAQRALAEPSGEPAWRRLPSWSIYGSSDLNIPAAAHAFMARRAQVRRVVAVPGASHVVMVSHPDEVADLIVEAAEAP